MEISPRIPNSEDIDHLAERSGCAVSLIDDLRHEVYTSNNNSICKELNPGPGFSPNCDDYCGHAFTRAMSAGQEIVDYRCHAGLDCRAMAFDKGQRPLVAIIGRSFTDADRYREATERAISGDWSSHSPNDFFDNVLMSGSERHLDEIAGALQRLAPKPIETKSEQPAAHKDGGGVKESHRAAITDAGGDDGNEGSDRDPSNVKGISKWRSFASSLPRLNYTEAAEATLAFLAEQFRLRSLIWLTRANGRLEGFNAFGRLRGRNLRISIGAEDARLLSALENAYPLEIAERRNSGQRDARKMFLFPIGIEGTISSAIAALDPLDDEVKSRVVLICRSIAPQIEILRLRQEVERSNEISSVIRKFTQSLKRSGKNDLWLTLMQNAAELLKAERSSLLVFDEDSQRFQIKAILGAPDTFRDDPAVGERVAKYVFDKNRAIAVENIAKAGLPETTDRTYKTPSFLSSPISAGDRVIGVMNFADRAGGEPFNQKALELFESIAPHLAIALDRAELEERAGQFERLSVTDELTGLLNRRYMEERLIEETKRSNRHGYPMSFMMLDVDEFKSYNDNYGHPAGDQALKLVGSVMRDTLRSADVAARFGGEEFAILLPQTTPSEALIIADRIRANIEKTKFPHRPVTISIGVSSCSAELCQDADLVSAADQALYKAKRGGRNRVVTFENDLEKVPA